MPRPGGSGLALGKLQMCLVRFPGRGTTPGPSPELGVMHAGEALGLSCSAAGAGGVGMGQITVPSSSRRVIDGVDRLTICWSERRGPESWNDADASRRGKNEWSDSVGTRRCLRLCVATAMLALGTPVLVGPLVLPRAVAFVPALTKTVSWNGSRSRGVPDRSPHGSSAGRVVRSLSFAEYRAAWSHGPDCGCCTRVVREDVLRTDVRAPRTASCRGAGTPCRRSE